MSKANDNVQTPEWVYKSLGLIDVDPCAGPDTNIGRVSNLCKDREDWEDGLALDWLGFWFCNPPFSQKELWIAKCLEQWSQRGQSGILLLPERGSAPWFGPLAELAGHYWVMGKKINFIGGPSSNNVGSVLFLFGEQAVSRIKSSRLPGHLCSVSMYRERPVNNV